MQLHYDKIVEMTINWKKNPFQLNYTVNGNNIKFVDHDKYLDIAFNKKN